VPAATVLPVFDSRTNAAKGQECDREVGKTAGANDYMTKPFSPSKILDRAREILGS
jgi:DNA-binding response OmpR family regulator